jgi:hypothetical protein
MIKSVFCLFGNHSWKTVAVKKYINNGSNETVRFCRCIDCDARISVKSNCDSISEEYSNNWEEFEVIPSHSQNPIDINFSSHKKCRMENDK